MEWPELASKDQHQRKRKQQTPDCLVYRTFHCSCIFLLYMDVFMGICLLSYVTDQGSRMHMILKCPVNIILGSPLIKVVGVIRAIQKMDSMMLSKQHVDGLPRDPDSGFSFATKEGTTLGSYQPFHTLLTSSLSNQDLLSGQLSTVICLAAHMREIIPSLQE